MRRYNRVNYQYGYVTAEECVYGLAELSALAEYAGRFDLTDALRKKSDKLRELPSRSSIEHCPVQTDLCTGRQTNQLSP